MKAYAIFAIAGIAILYILSQFSSPPKVNLNELWKYNGKEVMIEGKIINKIGNILEITDGNSTAFLYSWNKNFSYGDKIKAIGIVDEKNGYLIVYANYIKLIEKWNKNCISIPYLAENFNEYVNCNINVTGYIYSVYSNYFYLIDKNNEYKIKVYYDNATFKKFDNVYVEGILKYNSHRMEFYIEGKNAV